MHGEMESGRKRETEREREKRDTESLLPWWA